MYYDYGDDQTQDKNLYQQQGAEPGSEGPPSTYGGIDPSADAFQDHIDAWKTEQQVSLEWNGIGWNGIHWYQCLVVRVELLVYCNDVLHWI